MPNDTNKLLMGLYSGVGSLVSGELERQDQERFRQQQKLSSDLYNNAIKGLNDLMTKYSSEQETAMQNSLNPTIQNDTKGQFSTITSKSDNEEGLTIKKQPISMNDLYSKYDDLRGQLLKYGKPGEEQVKRLEDYYKVITKNPELKVTSVNGIPYWYKEGEYKLNPFINSPEKKKTYTIADYGSMSYDDVLKLDEKEFNSGLDYFNKDVRAKVFENNDVLRQENDKLFKEGDYAPKRSGGRRRISSKGGGSDVMTEHDKDVKTSLINLGQDIASGDESGIEQYVKETGLSYDEVKKRALSIYNSKNPKKEFEDYKEVVTTKKQRRNIEDDARYNPKVKEIYDNANDDEKTALANVDNFKSDVIKAWGRADLTPADWRKEILEEQWTALEEKIIRKFFKQQFGEDL